MYKCLQLNACGMLLTTSIPPSIWKGECSNLIHCTHAALTCNKADVMCVVLSCALHLAIALQVERQDFLIHHSLHASLMAQGTAHVARVRQEANTNNAALEVRQQFACARCATTVRNVCSEGVQKGEIKDSFYPSVIPE